MVGGVAEGRGVADQDGAGADRLEEGLVVVHGDRVGALDAVEQAPAGGGGEQSAAVRGVHVHPGAELLAQLGDLGQRVDGAEVGGAGGGDDGHGHQALLAAAVELAGERDGLHALVVVDGDRR